MKNNTLFFSAFIGVMILPITQFAQAPILGSVSGFALFTITGAVTNVGTTNVTGDVGTNAGALTGFPPGIITGTFHVADAVSLLAATDLNTANASLTTVPCDTAIGVGLGSGQILKPYVYCIGAASTLTGNLILDAQGDPNALFIFKIDGALSGGAFTTITLINSASPCNVYWQINGAFALGDSSVFNGTAIVNGAITLNTGVLFTGRVLAIAGQISTTSMAATVLPCYVSVALPVELIHFGVTHQQSQNILSWSTASEMNNDYFTLERTTDGITFTQVARIVGSGTSSCMNDYSYVDDSFDKTLNYYRLTQTDFDGESQVLGYVIIDNTVNNHEVVKIVDMLGRVVNETYEGYRLIYYSDGKIETKTCE